MTKIHELHEVLPHLLKGGHVRREFTVGGKAVYRQNPTSSGLCLEFLDNGVWTQATITHLYGYEIIPKMKSKVIVPRPESLPGHRSLRSNHKGYAVPADAYAALIRFVRAFDENRKRQCYDSQANLSMARDAFELEGDDA